MNSIKAHKAFEALKENFSKFLTYLEKTVDNLTIELPFNTSNIFTNTNFSF